MEIETIYYIIANITVLILIMNRDNLFRKSYITQVSCYQLYNYSSVYIILEAN